MTSNIFSVINQNELMQLSNDCLARFGVLLNEENVDLIVQTRFDKYDLLDMFEKSKTYHLPSFRLLAWHCFTAAKNNELQNHALKTLKVLSSNVAGVGDSPSRYYYALCLIEHNDIPSALEILKCLSSDKFAPAQCRWAVINWLGLYDQEKNMVLTRKLLEEASLTGHVKSRLFYTRFKLRHGRISEKLATPLFALLDLVYILKLGRPPHDMKFLY